MIVVLECAARKSPQAGHLRLRDGRAVKFVADPERAPPDGRHTYARPDDLADTGKPWRKELLDYNADPKDNRLGLLPAWHLYQNKTYAMLAHHFGLENFYILSAGWGLIRSYFLTPDYDITFSMSADKFKRRQPRDRYEDFRMIPPDSDKPIVFFVSKEYASLADQLTAQTQAPRCLLYNAAKSPDLPGLNLVRYVTRTRTNWQYECAKAFLNGSIKL